MKLLKVANFKKKSSPDDKKRNLSQVKIFQTPSKPKST